MSAGPARRSQRPPRFYFSLRSPYSYLAYRDLLTHHPQVAARLEWVPFFEPDQRSLAMLAEAGGSFPYTPMSRQKHHYILQDARRLATARGLSLTWPVDRDPVWEVPHLAYLAARRHGLGPAFIAQAARTRWEQGRDICDRKVVAEMATVLGLDGDELAGAAEDAVLRVEGVQALLAVDRDGVFGVPFFVHRRQKFWGVDRLPAFLEALGADPVRTEPPVDAGRLVTVPAPPGVDDGHAGGCG
ncbi:2-hydroxychromene-2-carboxylate isomerase [Salinispora sp. H7-4]|uniref:2-hydroxychromene-2-carboxylate isomerase n=1 Tax=Salinispora sp. H7-4 TaxID=2748321 RepID=UPI0015D159E9|nr:DsbA family protein [Salinispora sp. H7-4]NYT96274.1 DsbA family protein [Salinispora sp. H7-4]